VLGREGGLASTEYEQGVSMARIVFSEAPDDSHVLLLSLA